MVHDRWLLRSANGTNTTINQGSTQSPAAFEEMYNVTLMFNRSREFQSGCSGEFIQYSLKISNINGKVHGLEVRCGARLIADPPDDDRWEASHVTEILIGKYKMIVCNY